MLNEGNTHKQVAELIGCSLSEVAYWSVHGDPENLDSLKDERMNGNYRKATSEYINLLLEVIEIEPEKYGDEFGRWTTVRLATYLEEKTGIKLSGTSKENFTVKKVRLPLDAQHSLDDKQNPAKRTLFKKKLSEYLQVAKEFPKQGYFILNKTLSS